MTFSVTCRYFVAGGLEVKKADLKPTDKLFGYRKKFTAGHSSLANFFGSKKDAVPFGLLLLYSQEPMAELRITQKNKYIKVTPEIKKTLKDKMIDMVVFGTASTIPDRCLVFEQLRPNFVEPIRKNYILRDINLKEKDLSLNRCTASTSPYLPKAFKLGKLTPGQDNDCKGTKFLLENEDIVEAIEHEACQSPKEASCVSIDLSESPAKRARIDEEACMSYAQPAKRIQNLAKDHVQSVLSNQMDKGAVETCSGPEGIQMDSGNNFVEDMRAKERASLHFDAKTYVEDFTSTKYFKEVWLDQMKEHQNSILPIGAVAEREDIKQWFEYVYNEMEPSKSTVRCRICYRWFDKLHLHERYKSDLATENGMLTDDYETNRRKISKHSSSKMHVKIVEMLREKFSDNDLAKKLRDLEEKQHAESDNVLPRTASMMRTVYAEVLLNIPFASHQTIVQLMERNEVKKSHHHYERTSALRMATFIGDYMHSRLIESLNTRRGYEPLAIIVDGSTDPNQNHYLIVYFQVLDNNFPLIYFYRLIPLTDDETANGLLDKLKEAWEEDGLTAFMKHNIIGFASDGAPVMVGPRNGLKQKLEGFVGHSVVGVHCLAHRAQLAFRRAFKDLTYMFHFESTVTQFHKFYNSHGHKRKGHLKANFGDTFIGELSPVFEIRWISSEKSALDKLIKNHEVLLKDLQLIAAPESNFDANTKSTATGLFNRLTNKDFVALLYYLCDVLGYLSNYSENVQKRAGILVEQADTIQNLLKSLRRSASVNGETLIKLLKKSSCNSAEGCSTIGDYEASDVKLFGFQLERQPRSAFQPLSDIRFALIKKLEQEIESYLPENNIEVYKVLDP